MKKTSRFGTAARWLGLAAGVGAGAYGSYVAATWWRYGDPAPPEPGGEDPLLDQFMPTYDVVDRHHARVHAPAAVTLDAARSLDLFNLPVVQAIFRGRELIMGADPAAVPSSGGLLEDILALGWVVLAETPGRQIVVGSVTKPWEANPTFRSIPAAAFAAFSEPDYVKIAWTLRADPIDSDSSLFGIETRAVATDAEARRRFRTYWAFLSPGILLIRLLSLGPVRSEAERRAARADTVLQK